MRKLLALLILVAAPAFAQTNFGGYTAPPPRPSVSGANIEANPGFTSAITTGYASHISCGAIVADANAPSGQAFQLVGVNSGGTCNTFTGTSFTPTAASLTSNVATLTFAANPHIGAETIIKVSGFTGSDTYFNGLFTVSSASSISPWTISFPLTHANGTATTTGTVTLTVTTTVLAIESGVNGNGNFGQHDGQAYSIEISTSSTFNGQVSTALDDWANGALAAGFSFENPLYCPTASVAGCTTGGLVSFVGPGQGYITYQMSQLPVKTFYQGDKMYWYIKISNFNTGSINFTNTVMKDWYVPLKNFVTAPNNSRGYFYTDFSYPGHFCEQLDSTPCASGTMAGVAEIDPPTGLTASTLTVKMATASDCSSGVVQTFTKSNPSGTQWWSIASGLSPQTTPTTAYYICPTVTWSNATTATFPSYKFYPLNSTFRSTLVSYIDQNNYWNHNGISRFVWTTADRIPSSREDNVSLYTTKAGYESGLGGVGVGLLPLAVYGSLDAVAASTTTPVYGPGCGISGVVNCVTPTLFADYSANRFDAAEWAITSVQACTPLGGVGTDQCTPFMQAANDYNMGTWETTQGDYGYLLSHTTTVPSVGPSAPTLASSSSSGGSISAAYVFVEVSAWNESYFGTGGNAGQIKDTLPSSALVIGPLSGSTNQVTVTMPTCADYRVYGYHTWIATNTTNTVPAQSAFYFSDPTPDGEACSAAVTFTTVPAGGANPPTTDSTGSGLWSWCSACTDTTAFQDLATTVNSQAGSGFFYITDENFADSAEDVWQKAQTLYSYAPGVITWSNEGGSANCTAAGRERFVVDVPSCDPYGEAETVSDKTDLFYMYGNSSHRTCLAYIGAFNVEGTYPDCDGPANTATWVNYIGQVTYGSRATIPYFWDALATTELSQDYRELWRSVWDMVVAEKARGNGGGITSWGWISSTGMTVAVQQFQDIQAWQDYLHVSDDLMSKEKILLQEPVDATYLDCDQTFDPGAPGCTGTVDGVGGLTLNGGVVLANITSASTATNVCGTGSGVINTTFWPANFAQFFTEKDPATGDQYIWFSNLCNSGNSATPTAPVMTFTLANVPTGATVVDARNSGGSYSLTLTPVTCPAADTQAHNCATFTDTWGATQASGTTAGNDMDAYQYIVRAPRGVRIGN